MIISLGGIVCPIWLAYAHEDVFIEVFQNPIAAFGLIVSFPVIGIIVHGIGRVLTITGFSEIPRWKK
ncbi:MAG: hypothetical protein WCV80_01450 [Candidatus Paceibacterota bacterium]|jgi:hypothetical protein